MRQYVEIYEGKKCDDLKTKEKMNLQLYTQTTDLKFSKAKNRSVKTSNRHKTTKLKEVSMVIKANTVIQP